MPEDRVRHAEALIRALSVARQEASLARSETIVSVQGAEPGLYLQFEGFKDVPLKAPEYKPQGIELVAFHPGTEANPIERATVFAPDKSLKHLESKITKYLEGTKRDDTPSNRNLVDRIRAIRKATLRDIWTDTTAAFPPDHKVIWWEIWLRRDNGQEYVRFLQFAEQVGLEVGGRRLAFPGLLVVQAKGTANQLSASLDVMQDFAEVRMSKGLANFLVDEPIIDQVEWVNDLRGRSKLPDSNAPAVCILDTGITKAHPLLAPLIDPSDTFAVNHAWGTGDDGGGPEKQGHGTQMGGLAAYGDLGEALASSGRITVYNQLESVKILPPRGKNEPDLYGAVTAQAVSLPEINKPYRKRVFSLAVSSDDRGGGLGQPSSWSAAIDALAAGRLIAPGGNAQDLISSQEGLTPRLFVLAAGNAWPGDTARDLFDRSDNSSIQDPAQAWNALTVGAYTERTVIDDPELSAYSPMAARGEISPWSTTSVTFEPGWPIKPDIVLEGGNVGVAGSFPDFGIPDLCLLTTHYKPHERLLVQSSGTSAAAAQAARLAAIIAADYPDLWPETVRGLIVHSARWTTAMGVHFDNIQSRRELEKLVRRYGYGVPNIERARRSANDSLTLISQSTINIFQEDRYGDMNLHDLPWPRTELLELGEATVQLRVTLSYFIEPKPGRRGWRETKYQYASHGLRFKLNGPGESREEFRKRVNFKARAEGEKGARTGGPDRWLLGEHSMKKGSLHSNIWTGSAAELAQCNLVGVMPTLGWWKALKPSEHPGTVRYALIVSIETDAADVDLWTPVAVNLNVPIATSL